MVKRIKRPETHSYIGNLSFDTKIDDLHELFGLRSTKYLRETCKTNIPVNKKTGKCKGFEFTVSAGTCAKRNSKLNAITLENKIIVMQDATSARKRDAQNLQTHPKRPLVVTNKHPENQRVFNFSKVSTGMKTYVGATRPKEKKKSYIIGVVLSFIIAI